MKYCIVMIICLLSLVIPAQKNNKLETGDEIRFSRITLINQDKKNSNIDLPNGKTMDDRFVLVYFYSASTPLKELVSFNNDIERVLNKYQNNACKGASTIEYVTICIEKDYTKWKTLLAETNYNKSKFTGKKANYLAQGGLKDKAVTAFKVTKVPSLFLVNPKGRLFVETDSIDILQNTFESICRANMSSSTADISGKLLIGDKNKLPLKEHHVYLIKENKDTVKTTSTDNFGDFRFIQIDTTQDLSIIIEQNSKTKSGTKVYLAKQSGEVITEIKKNSIGRFEYRLLPVDVQKLSELEEDDDITLKYKKFTGTNKKDLTVTENVYYESNKFVILTENEIVLDKVLVILNNYPLVQLEVISHTDALGDDASNLKLSQSRSNAVIDYLVSKGISKSRLKAVGKGESEIRNRCGNNVECSDKEHEYNRRTEFKFIKN